MIKESQSTHKIPYFDIATKTLLSVNKDKHSYHDVMCVCSPTEDCYMGDRPVQAGYKYEFQYSITPTMEPISYRLKGYTQNAVLTYKNIGENIKEDSMEEILKYMQFIKSEYLSGVGTDDFRPIITSIDDFKWNEYDNQVLENKIFQKTKRFEQRGEEYSPTEHLNHVCMNLNLSSQIYTVSAKFEIIDQHNAGI